MFLSEVLEKAREIARDVVAPKAEEVDLQAKWPAHVMKALQESRLTGLVASKEVGGLGMGLEAVVKVSEILGRECPSSGLCFGMHCVGTAVINAKATDFQKQNFLVPIAEGKHITTLALSEPGTGAHFYYPQTQLLLDGTDFILNGTKSFVTNGNHADSYVLSTIAADINAPAHEFSCIILPAGTRGMEWTGEWSGFGMRGNSSLSVHLNNVRVSSSLLLGDPGDQLWYVFQVIAPYFLSAMSGTYLGLSQSALDIANENISSRHYSHSGASLSGATFVQHKLGELWTKVAATRELVYSAARAGDSSSPDAIPYILSAKAEVANCAVTVTNEAMTLCGGREYQQKSRLARLLRDARASHVMAPTTDILFTWLGRHLTGVPLLVD